MAIAVLVTAAPASFPFRHRSPADGPELAAAQPDPLPGPRTVPGQVPPHKAGPQSWPPGPAPCRSAPRTGRSQPAPGPNRRSPHTDRRSPHTAVSAGPGRLLIWWHCLRQPRAAAVPGPGSSPRPRPLHPVPGNPHPAPRSQTTAPTPANARASSHRQPTRNSQLRTRFGLCCHASPGTPNGGSRAVAPQELSHVPR